jgi:hypothetical protein
VDRLPGARFWAAVVMRAIKFPRRDAIPRQPGKDIIIKFFDQVDGDAREFATANRPWRTWT